MSSQPSTAPTTSASSVAPLQLISDSASTYARPTPPDEPVVFFSALRTRRPMVPFRSFSAHTPTITPRFNTGNSHEPLKSMCEAKETKSEERKPQITMSADKRERILKWIEASCVKLEE
ncbi:uncharacterized protein MELLADRAFT_102797 [Melampsora larici-populina 98AG31]|uniref:Uncharacterized protein n=1 Tax=Melampsora larici-populina (strain 98AG31 / pathotype 3-4-7) TaxID=747676 RepID=F4R9E6_MELLP|nr:uncharacterized protein MELLADRAFT_102797 [Melampsora larici-populina 98AG31]EGG10972.1 hypothetical protein MELLADRAFT_102797 [Melampsora larici-populina 98AG31]